jgi:hypothetical protein
MLVLVTGLCGKVPGGGKHRSGLGNADGPRELVSLEPS